MQSTQLAGLHVHVATIVRGYLKANRLVPDDLPRLITIVYLALQVLARPDEMEPSRNPAVPIGQSAGTGHVTCLDCGWRGLRLRRHIAARHALTEHQYRARWNLSREHPLVAAEFSRERSDWAKRTGLGRR